VLGASIAHFLCLYLPLPLPFGEQTKAVILPKLQIPDPVRHNIPLVTWLALRGRCANCGARISFRYSAWNCSRRSSFWNLAEGLELGPAGLAAAGLDAGVALLDHGGAFRGRDVHRLEHFIIPMRSRLAGRWLVSC